MTSKILSFGKELNVDRKHGGKKEMQVTTIFLKDLIPMVISPFPNKPWFLSVYKTSLLKTLGKGAVSPFPTLFSTHLEKFYAVFVKFEIVVSNSLSLDESKICRLVITVIVWLGINNSWLELFNFQNSFNCH